MASLLAKSVFLLILVASALFSQEPQEPTPAQVVPDRFATANGVRLHYIDWGGTGEAILFLTSLGGTAEDFQPIAQRFTDRYHVLGLTRRGQGKSEKPFTGYDNATRTEDILAFLNALNIQRATLVGYSMAGDELTELAGAHPERVSRLVYLDAAYDLAENAELARKANLNLPVLPGADQPTQKLLAGSNEYRPDYTRIRAPALGIFVTYDQPQPHRRGMKPPGRSSWRSGLRTVRLTAESRSTVFRAASEMPG